MKFLQKGVRKNEDFTLSKKVYNVCDKRNFSFFIKLFLFLFIVGIIISAVIKSFEEKPTVAIKIKLMF